MAAFSMVSSSMIRSLAAVFLISIIVSCIALGDDAFMLDLTEQIVKEGQFMMHESYEHTLILESAIINTKLRPPIGAEPYVPFPNIGNIFYSTFDPVVGNSTFIVQFSESEQEQVSEVLLHQFGIAPIHYLPHNAFVIYTTHRKANSLKEVPGITWVGTLRPEEKLSLTLTKYRDTTPDEFFGVGDLGDPLHELVVTLPTVKPHRTISECEVIASRIKSILEHDEAKLNGGTLFRVARHDRIIFSLKCDEDLDLAAILIAADPAIMFVERRLRHQFLNRWARGIIQNGLNATANYKERDELLAWKHGLDGEDQVLGLGDSGVDKRSCFFASRSVSKAASPPQQHDHVGNHLHLFRVSSNDEQIDADTSDKIISYIPFADAEDTSGHGTHVAGTLVGKPILEPDTPGTLPTFAGMAPEGRLAIVDVGDADGAVVLPDDLTTGYLAHTYLAGARIHTNSWGASAPLYTSEARDMDEFVYHNRDFVVVNAAGNGGACDAEMTIVAPATSKNGIAVGASLSNAMSYAKTELTPPGLDVGSPHLNERCLASFSSSGPTLDGRMKPDVVAPGFFVFSANSGTGDNSCAGPLGDVVTPNAGTSMAAPIIAGSMALIRQYFVQGFHPSGKPNRMDEFMPSGSLLKACTIHGAIKLNGTRLMSDVGLREDSKCLKKGFKQLDRSPNPDLEQGFGRTQLNEVLFLQGKQSLHILGRDNKSLETFGDPSLTSNAEEHVYDSCALETREAIELRVTMVYTDAPATLGAGIQLVNDLDLEVHFGDRVYHGNGGSSFDRRNPVERVVVMQPSFGEGEKSVRVVIRAHRINVGDRQTYSALLSGSVREGPCQKVRGNTKVKGDASPYYRLVVGEKDLRRTSPAWIRRNSSARIAKLQIAYSFILLWVLVFFI